METMKIDVYGMACGGCERTVEAALKSLPGVKSVKADHTKKNVEITYTGDEFNRDKVLQAVEKTGYHLNP